jgi:hypothetical protein
MSTNMKQLFVTYCIKESIALEQHTLAKQYLDLLDQMKPEMDSISSTAVYMALWQDFVQQYFSIIMQWMLEHQTFLNNQELQELVHIQSIDSFGKYCDFIVYVLEIMLSESKRKKDKERTLLIEEQSEIASITNEMNAMSLNTTKVEMLLSKANWLPSDPLLSNLKSLSQVQCYDNEAIEHLISLLKFVRIMLLNNVGGRVKINLAKIYPKKLLLSILKNQRNIAHMDLSNGTSNKETAGRASTFLAGLSKSKMKNESTKEYQLDIIRQLLERDMLSVAIVIAEQKCFIDIDTDSVYLELLHIIQYNEGKEESAYDIVKKLQSPHMKMRGGKILMDIATRQVTEILSSGRIELTDENKSYSSKNLKHVLSNVPPKLFSYLTQYMKGTMEIHRQETKQESNSTSYSMDKVRIMLQLSIQMLSQAGNEQSNDYQIAKMLLDLIDKLSHE